MTRSRGRRGPAEGREGVKMEAKGKRNNEFPGLSLNPEDSFLIIGIVAHFVESHHQNLCTNISHFDLLYLLSFVFCQKAGVLKFDRDERRK